MPGSARGLRSPPPLLVVARHSQYAEQGADALNSGPGCHLVSLSPITIAHSIKRMSEVGKLKTGKRVILFSRRQASRMFLWALKVREGHPREEDPVVGEGISSKYLIRFF